MGIILRLLLRTFRDFIENCINNGKSVILEVDVHGAVEIKRIYPDAILIYIAPPSLEELRIRLKKRQTENEEDLEGNGLREQKWN